MKKHSTLFVLMASLMLVFMAFTTGQSQTMGFSTLITGQVTAGPDSTPVSNYMLMITLKTDTSAFRMIKMTDDHGNYQFTVLKNNTYVITSPDTFTYKPFYDEVEVKEVPVIHNINLQYQENLLSVNGSVQFHNAGVQTDVYFLKIPDSVDLNDFRQYEFYFHVPKVMLRWASYSAETDSLGNFTVHMLAGKYVVYIPANKEVGYLNYWDAFEVNSDTTLTTFEMKELQILSGHVTNAGKYDMVRIYAHPLQPSRPYMAIPDSLTGDYSMELAPGKYVLRCVAYFDNYRYMMFYDSVFTPKEATQIDVHGEVTGIDFNLPDPQVAPFSISGTVTSRQSGLPLEGANVVFVSYNFLSNLWQTWQATTDADGHYKVEGFTMLQEDSLVGFAWKDSTFLAQFYNNKPTLQTADPIIYHANEDVQNIDFALDTLDTENGHSISGMLLNEKGEPIPMGSVTAYTTAANVGVITVQVDSTGHYAFDPVFPKGAKVYLQAWGGYDYLPEFYNNAHTWKDAEPIVIGDNDVTGLNFVLQEKKPTRILLAKIKGWVKNQGQDKASLSEQSDFVGGIVYAKPAGTDEWTGYSYIKEDGSFDLPVESDGTYVILVTTKDGDTESTVEVKNLEAQTTVEITGIPQPKDNLVVKTDQLFNAYPNPFNPSTTIKVQMAQTGPAQLIIYNVLGQKVRTLYNGVLTQGIKKFTWNGKDNAGRQVASGLYFYQLKTQNVTQTKAVMFIK